MNLQLKTRGIKLLVLSAAFSAQPSYSDYVFGTTDNAAAGGSTWGMSDPLFPVDSIPGIDINGVFYRYTAIKEQGDPYTVSVQNKTSSGSGYIFRETDDWTRGSGGTIQKFIPLQYSPLGDWGDGEINEVGLGRVENPIVMYSYRVDTNKLQPKIDFELPTITPYDYLSDEYVLNALEPTDLSMIEDISDESNSDDQEDEENRLEDALAASENAITMANGISQAAILQSMNIATNLNAYYSAQLQGSKYQEAVVLIDKNIPDNKRAFRSLGQQKLHTDMVNQQYGR